MLIEQFLTAQTLARGAELGSQFAHAKPFRHVVIDNFFTPTVLNALIQDFPAFNPALARNENGEIGLKAVNERISALGACYAELDRLLQSNEWLNWVSQATGIKKLRYDPDYFGGGTHDNKHGQSLDTHIDFNRHPRDNSHRRLNLIVYLNEGWQEAWGGQLELHSDPHSESDQITRINPLLNRCVIFETTEYSWHAFNEIRLPEDRQHRSRKSSAIYLYTLEREAEQTGPLHSTIYVDQPLPEFVRAGHVLSEADAQQLRILTARRDQHVQRLYREITQLSEQLARSRLRRVWKAIQRLLIGRKQPAE